MDESDVEFLQAMIAHHEAALEMASAYLADTKPTTRQARVADLARGIVKAQTAEIATMRGWLRSAGKTAGSGRGPMRGM